MNNPRTVLAVDLGGTKVLVGEVTADGKVLTQVRYPSDVRDQLHAMAQIRRAIQTYLKTAVNRSRISAISVSAVGRINPDNGEWYEIDPNKGHLVAVAQQLNTEFGLPAYAANDVYCATVAEREFGIGRQTNNFVYLNVGTGIAGRVVDQGKIITGNHYNAGEIGHMVVDINSSLRCVCGRYGCVEPLASGLGMSERAKAGLAQHPESKLTIDKHGRIGADQLFTQFDLNDPVAVPVVTTALKALSVLIMNVVRVTDPEAIVLGGGVTNGGWLLDHLQPYLTNEAMRFIKYGVTRSTIDPNLIALKGAALNGFQRKEQHHESDSQKLA